MTLTREVKRSIQNVGNADDMQKFEIVGSIVSVAKDKKSLSVSVPRNAWTKTRLTIAIEDDVALPLSGYVDSSCISPGDSIAVSGSWATEVFQQRGFPFKRVDFMNFVASKMKITLQGPVGAINRDRLKNQPVRTRERSFSERIQTSPIR